MIRYFRPYRGLRVALALCRVIPRYWILVARDRIGRRPALQSDWDRVHRIAAREIKNVALALGGALTKGAQIGGARADILPDPFIEELSQFHDAVPPRPTALMRRIVERDLGRPVDEIFASFDETSIAAASLAQVHRARLRDGSDVAVKIQYPEVRRVIPMDLAMLRLVARIVQRLQPYVDVRAMVEEVTRFIELELDFRREVESTVRLRSVLEALPDVRVPHVYRELCGDDVIVLEFIDGIQVTRRDALVAAGHSLSEVARKIGGLYGAMMFELGFFHGDPHPGNLLVLPDGRIGLLDFGLCKELPEGFARRIAQMMVGALIGDSESALEAAAALGFDTSTMKGEHLRTLMLNMIGDTDSDESVFSIISESRIRTIPEDFALVVRTLILLNGLSHRLAPRRRLLQAELIQHLATGAARSAPAVGAAA